jgi:hypothetical protein
MNDITAAQAGTGAWATVIENSKSAAGMYKLMYAAWCNISQGGGSNTIIFRDDADSKNRIVATVTSAGNRTAVNKDVS